MGNWKLPDREEDNMLCGEIDAFLKDEIAATKEYMTMSRKLKSIGADMFVKMSRDESSHAEMLHALRDFYCPKR